MASPLHQFEITKIIPLEIAGIDVSFTNSALWMMIATVVSMSFLILASRKQAMVPSRTQAASEQLYGVVSTMIRENIGPKGAEYFPLIFTVFLIVLTGNLLGLLPYSFTYTSHIFVTGALAMFLFFTIIIISLMKHGLHFFDLFNPPGVPLLLKPLIIPIEVISYFVRPVTLSVRLFANMMAGHLVLKVFAGFSVAMAAAFGLSGIAFGAVPALFNVVLFALELLVALLQAYVFAILTCIYFKDAVELHH